VTETFTDWLRQRSEPDWTAVVTHPFTQALFDGLVPTDSMRSYLVQDYQFVDDFVALLGSALAKADRYSSRLAIAGCIAVVTSEENTYFQRAFYALGVGEADRVSPKLDAATVAFRDLMHDANQHGSYAEVLTVLTVAEWTYLEWAMRAPAALPENFVHAEWITLHNNPDFQSWVQWLTRELDRVGADLDERDRARCLRIFQQATRCELDFFNAHWV
jgi:thiaminase (transcriptional activator TenA)